MDWGGEGGGLGNLRQWRLVIGTWNFTSLVANELELVLVRQCQVIVRL